MIAPKYEALSNTFTKVKFLKVNVDEAQAISATCAIRSMPTFLFFKNGTKVDSMIGADPKKLEEKVAALAK